MRRLGTPTTNRFGGMPVGRMLLLGFGFMALVVAAMAYGMFGAVEQLGSANDEIVGRSAPRVLAATQLRVAVVSLQQSQSAYMLSDAHDRAPFETARHEFEDALGIMRSGETDPAHRALIEKIATGYQTFLAIDQLILDSVQHGETALAANLATGAEQLDAAFMDADAESLSMLEQRDAATAATRFAATTRAARRAAWVLGAIGALSVIVLSAVITRAIRNPLTQVQEAAERAAAGDLAAEANVVGTNETGRLAAAFNTMLANLRARENVIRRDHQRQQLDGQISRSLEMTDTEDDALEAVRRALGAVTPERRVEFLLADNSKAHLTQVVVAGPDPTGPGCDVDSPFACAAVRSGHTITFPDSNALDACPRLLDRPYGPCSATCVPVTFMGRAMGVIHAVGPVATPLATAEVEGLNVLSTQAGARIGILRSMAKTQIQATTDGLTGLINRRTFETRARAVLRNGTRFAVVMADLDHFKSLNDTFGHAAGDAALRVFAEVMQASVRAEDLVARFGGEEFALLLHGANPTVAVETAERVREALALNLTAGDTPQFTASFGVVESSQGTTLEELLRLADFALYAAKDQGRNRVVVSDGSNSRATSSSEFTSAGNVFGATPNAGRASGLFGRSDRHTGFAAIAAYDDPLDP